MWAPPEDVVRIARQAGMVGGPVAELLVITAGWTGCRWGELTGLQRDRVDLDRGLITIDKTNGCLHESSHGMWLGPPKTVSSARTIQLPPFLTDLLRKHLAQHSGQLVFTGPKGGWLRRSDFNRRIFKPAVEGDPDRGLEAVRPGLTFHGLRHSHKTWLANDMILPIASAKRLGHHVPDKLEEIYTHVAPKMERKILSTLQQMWQHAQRAVIRLMGNHSWTRPSTLTGRHRGCSTQTQASSVTGGLRQGSSVQPTSTPARRSHPTNARLAASRASSLSSLRAHHKAAALRSAPAAPQRPIPRQMTPLPSRAQASGDGTIMPQDRPNNPSERDHGRQRVSIIKRMKKSLRPARMLRSKSFDREWA
ncbi:MAG TPA: site-specific integrase [Pseudonocardiaceae bacterium]|nr:site-specific integrase [Pseudonocardiaceae bacterium]